jgi:hypothetical protein
MPDTGQVTRNGSGAGGADAPAGLAGVVVAHTRIGDVRGLEGCYQYRHYDAIELSTQRTLEDVWHLLFRGHLPDRAERAAFERQIAGHRVLPDDLVPFLRTLATTDPFDPLTALRTAISFVAQRSGFRSWLDTPPDQLYDNAMQVSAQTPVLLAALHRLHRGEQPVAADPALPAAANYLYMLSGEHPDRQRVWALERYLISTLDHGFNSSTFTARVITSRFSRTVTFAGPVREARLQQREAIRQDQFPGYGGRGILPGTFHGAADAVWRFIWRPGTGRMSALDVLAVLDTTAGEQPYALSVSAPAPDAGPADDIFQQLLQTFQPAP